MEFEKFMNGKNLFNERRRGINLYELATFEANQVFNKKYEDLNGEELRKLIKLVGELCPYVYK